ncbi:MULTISPECIES: TrkA family potassium uptake protein [Corynebacterium]|uniref:potassium channel family protein n=1 Tax=Corynebacterium TaxID=1716 RepID=UPI00124CEDEC|nr:MULTISPECIES: TrkA family potassium uptake protein [Corynebacterium]MBV7281925.1 TrkA family potassium uptake protein [Corynebacterium sp. TAE3-ERU30]MBV7301558.1 TrkA family potassium uptake protein [Corynebacterium sp. TAE3-ERU2]
MAKQRVVILGLGRFGLALGEELVASGVDVVGVDISERALKEAEKLTHSVIADATDIEALKQLGVLDAEHVIVGIGEDMSASLLTVNNLKELGVTGVWAKADSKAHATILRSMGVNNLIRPGFSTGKRLAHVISGHAEDYIEFDVDYAMVKLAAPRWLHGHQVAEAEPDIVALKRSGRSFRPTVPDDVIGPDDILIAAGPVKTLERFCERRR